MDAKKDRAILIQAILTYRPDNYLYKYLTWREEQASFTEDCHLEHEGYLASLQKIKNDETNAKIAMDKFKVRSFFSLSFFFF